MNYNEESLKQLLGQVNTIDKAYKIVKQNTGEDFNLFQILGMETAEVKTHSRFLAELLNPNGSHMQGNTFLKLFIEYFNTLEIAKGISFLPDNHKIDLKSEKSKVQVEKFIGWKNDDEGGRIDICITEDESNKQNIICIENKIYAGEQDKQMQRYGNYAKNFTNSHLFYLTLWGNETKTNGSETVYPISYKTHIIEWLELCKKEAVNLPILRETIGQYTNLIKKLTHQTTNKKMAQEIQKIILKNYIESSLIYENFTQSVFNLYNNIIDKLAKNIKQYLDTDYPNWELYHIGRIDKIDQRGNLFIRPKNSNIDDGFGIEEFNPLCKYHHFGHRIFYGIINRKEITTFLEQAKDIDKTKRKGGWINYDFPKSDFFDFEKSTEAHIPKLIEEQQQDKFVEVIFTDFKNYFKKNQKEYLDYLKGV